MIVRCFVALVFCWLGVGIFCSRSDGMGKVANCKATEGELRVIQGCLAF